MKNVSFENNCIFDSTLKLNLDVDHFAIKDFTWHGELIILGHTSDLAINEIKNEQN